MKRWALTLGLLALLPSGLMAHQFYLSITTIQHHAESQKLTVSVKLFVNDLEEAIYQEKGLRLGLWKNEPIPDAQAYVAQYLASRLFISINDAPVYLEFISQQVEGAEVLADHVIICELEATDIAEIAKIKVQNSLLTEAFDSQTNIVKIRANDTRKSLNLDSRLSEGEVTF